MKGIQARNFHRGRISPIRLVVIHSMEIPEKGSTAEDCARMFATTTRDASAHVCVDNNSVVRCVSDGDTAWAAPGANADGLQMELAGFARQSRAQWLDAYGRDLLEQAARVAARWCTAYKIPIRRLTRAELRAGKKGITCHADVSAVYKRSDHTDPGDHFPWDVFLALVKAAAKGDHGDEEPEPPAFTVALEAGTRGEPVLVWQRRMRARGWNIKVDGVFSDADTSACMKFQQEKGLDSTGVVDEPTWRATWVAPIT